MKPNRQIRWALLMLLIPIMAVGQNAAVPWSSFSMGYVASSASGTMIRSVLGQSFVGQTQQGNAFIESGFLVDTLFRGTVVGVTDGPMLPTAFGLSQNYPNPFNPTTTINFQLPIGSSQLTILKIYDVLGREIETLVNEMKPAGEYSIQWNAASYPSGVYFYRLVAHSTDGGSTFTETKRLVLVK